MNSGMTVRGISWCVPEKVETNELLVQEFGTWTPEKILHKTGIAERHVAEAGVPASYYHVMVANKFYEEHPDIARDTIDMLVICTETRDYIAPATACVVHGQLGLRKTCGAATDKVQVKFRVNLLCHCSLSGILNLRLRAGTLQRRRNAQGCSE